MNKPSTILANAAPKRRKLGTLFEFYVEDDGTTRATLGRKTAKIADELGLKLTEEEADLVQALRMIGAGLHAMPVPQLPSPKVTVPFGEWNTFEIHHAAQHISGVRKALAAIVEKVHGAVGAQLQILADWHKPNVQRKRARKQIHAALDGALDAMEKGTFRKPHGNADAIPYFTDDDEVRLMPLAWWAIEMGRQLVEEKRALPTKGEIRERIEAIHSRALSKKAWTAIWKESGLSELPQNPPWTKQA